MANVDLSSLLEQPYCLENIKPASKKFALTHLPVIVSDKIPSVLGQLYSLCYFWHGTALSLSLQPNKCKGDYWLYSSTPFYSASSSLSNSSMLIYCYSHHCWNVYSEFIPHALVSLIHCYLAPLLCQNDNWTGIYFFFFSKSCGYCTNYVIILGLISPLVLDNHTKRVL